MQGIDEIAACYLRPEICRDAHSLVIRDSFNTFTQSDSVVNIELYI